jgi:hypothetical protein
MRISWGESLWSVHLVVGVGGGVLWQACLSSLLDEALSGIAGLRELAIAGNPCTPNTNQGPNG